MYIFIDHEGTFRMAGYFMLTYPTNDVILPCSTVSECNYPECYLLDTTEFWL